MRRTFDITQVVQFLPSATGCAVDALVQHPDDTSRVATQSICVTFGGHEMQEFILMALEYYRTHAVLDARVQNVRTLHGHEA